MNKSMQINVGGCEHFSLLCKWSATSFHGPTDAEVTRFINSCPITFQHLFTLPTLYLGSISFIRCECSWWGIFSVFILLNMFEKCLVDLDMWWSSNFSNTMWIGITQVYRYGQQIWKLSNIEQSQKFVLLFSRGLRQFVTYSYVVCYVH